MTKLRVGDLVKLKPGTIVGDRKGVRTATIQAFLDPEIPGGVFFQRPGLRGCRYWNRQDLEKVRT